SPLKANPFGIIKLNKGKAGIVSTLYAVYKVKEKNAYGPFLDYYFSLDANTNRYLRPLVKKGAKNDMKINNAYVLHDRIFAPTTDEQKRIATFFTVLEKKIAVLKQKKNLLEQYKKGVMQKLFSQELRFNDKNGEEYPKWVEKKFGEEIQDSGYGPRFNGEDYSSEGNVKTIRGTDISVDGEILYSQVPLAKLDPNFIKNHLLEDGDLVMITTADCGLTGVFRNQSIAYIPSAYTVKIKLKNSSNPYFFKYFFQTKIAINQVNKYIRKATVSNLPGSDILRFSINIPSLAEQTKIANFLSDIEEKLNRTEIQIQQTQEYKKGLLQKMYC
ncbi:MAG: restriction endonuclease subunit S, partial [Melioribacteraceae bacterium]